ncbi:MAG: response regulator transcription factor [Sediminibacterium sp.]|nr:response regulator transcription factor [Sediminibacterium sp.]
MIRILIADDHQMFIDGLTSLLVKEKDVEVTGFANTGEEVLKAVENRRPDVVLLDINMPGLNGIQTTAALKKKYPDIKILILTMYKTRAFINGLVRTGASGYILKNTGNAELLEAIRTVHAGGTFYSKAVAETLTERVNRYTETEDVSLSKREIEIIKELSKGLTTKEVAEKLFISFYTVETHRKNMLAKLQLTNTAELILYAAQSGLLDME